MKYLLSIFSIIFLLGCGGNSYHYVPNPVDQMIKTMKKEKAFTIILDDMDVKDDEFFHKYSVIKEDAAGAITTSETGMIIVDFEFFKKNENNLGMQIAAKDSTGKVTKAAIPAGFDRYIGNSRYGHWNQSGGQSFWVFYGQYSMLRSVFGLGYHPAYYGMHNSYYRGGYYGSSRSYYGTGANSYGTKSAAVKKGKPNFFSRKARNTNWKRSTSRSSSSRRSGRGGGFGFGK
tara:strand:+ start:646 stop:1338 length:693 start_codon:yes stop_codon:yes gene_type:complete